jgi:hypothetical protein
VDVEDFQRSWRRVRQAWALINQRKLEREAAGSWLTEDEDADWLRAKAEYEAFEQAWDEIYRAGVVIVVGEEEPDL